MISAIIIGAIIGVAVGFAGTAIADYKDDGKIFNGSISTEGYIANTLVGGIVGGIVGGLSTINLAISIPMFYQVLTSAGAVQTVIGTTTVLVNSGTIALTGILGGLLLHFARTRKSGGYYGERWSGDPHKPDHVHLRGNGIDIRIGRDGNPLPGENKLDSQARKALKKLWEEFIRLFDKW